MNIFEQTLRDLLVAANLVERRVWLWRAPQAPASEARTPYVVFFPIAPSPEHGHQGPLDMITRDYQLSIFDPSQTKVLALADSYRQYLDGYRGQYQDALIGACFHVNQTIAFEADSLLYHIIQQFRFEYHYPVTPIAVTTAVQTVRQGASHGR